MLCWFLPFYESAMVYICPLPVKPSPTPTPRLSQSPGLSSLSHTVNSHWLSILHMVMYVSMLLSSIHPTLSFLPLTVSMSLLSMSVSPLKVKVLAAQSFPILCSPMDYSLLGPWNSPVKNTGVGCHSLLQRIFLTQGLNPGFLHCRQSLYHLSHQVSHVSPLLSCK